MLHFTDDCLIGIDTLDDEHRYLFKLMEKIVELLHNEYLTDRYDMIKNVLIELDDYAELHFTHEEDYMRKIRDPELIRQRAQHAFFKERVHIMQIKNIDNDEEQQIILEDIVNFLAKWLYQHIIGSDIMIGKLPPLEEWMIKDDPCKFTDEFLVGVDLIDAEHKQLFKIIDKAYHLVINQVSAERDSDKIMEVLTRLKDYTEEHFRDEEEYMEQINYSGLEAQKRSHATFINRLEEITLDKIENNAQKYMESLIEFLLCWLINHILQSDKKIPN